MTKAPFQIGLIGCGDIARKAYLPFFAEHSDKVKVQACCDVRPDIAASLAEDFNIPSVLTSTEELVTQPEIDLVLNLTHPAGHAQVNRLALEAGKHVYVEKPFALELKEATDVLALASKRNLQVGCAPDTVLGPGIQTCRTLVDTGSIGTPLYGKLHMGGAGHEHWHPNPAFYYQKGGGPMLDMGPYYISALIQILGPVKRVEGRAVTGFHTRTISSEPLAGTEVEVNTPTHYVGSLETVSGVIMQILFSFDLKFGADGINLPEIYGSEGTLRCTNPNNFDGQPELNTVYPDGELIAQDSTHDYPAGRGLGVLDMLGAIRDNRPPRASGQIACHALEVMLAFEQSESEGRRIELTTTCEQPPPMPAHGLDL